MKPSVPPFAPLSIHISRVLLANSRSEDDDEATPPDPFVHVSVSDEVATTRALNDTLAGTLDQLFLFPNVSSDASIVLSVYDQDDDFNDMIGFVKTTPEAIWRSRVNGQLHFYTFNDSDGIIANITYGFPLERR